MTPTAALPTVPPKKRTMSAARRAIVEATRRRWGRSSRETRPEEAPDQRRGAKGDRRGGAHRPTTPWQ
jgi:hypothetical protein